MTTYTTGRLNTLIVSIGEEGGWMGYAGDFHPTRMNVVVNRIVTSEGIIEPKAYARAVEEVMRRECVDSVLIVLPNNTKGNTKQVISDELATSDVCRSIFFMNRCVSDVFGNGRTSGVVLQISKNITSVSLVVKGEVQSSSVIGSGFRTLFNETEELLKRQKDGRGPTLCPETVLNAMEAAMLSRGIDDFFYEEEHWSLMANAVGDFKSACLKWLGDAVSVLKSAQTKKSFGQGCIVLSGMICRYPKFIEKLVSEASENQGTSLSDTITYNAQLFASFTGASVFGMNNKSKTVFCKPGAIKYSSADETD